MSGEELAADRLRHQMHREHLEPAAVPLIPWPLLQPREQRLWLNRARACLEGDATARDAA